MKEAGGIPFDPSDHDYDPNLTPRKLGRRTCIVSGCPWYMERGQQSHLDKHFEYCKISNRIRQSQLVRAESKAIVHAANECKSLTVNCCK